MPADVALDPAIRKFASRTALSDDDREAIRGLPFIRRIYERPGYIVREGEPAPKHCSLILSGWAFRQKISISGARQIVSIHMNGDFLDLQHLFLDRADHSVQALSRVETAEIERNALQELVLERPAVGRAMWIDALVDSSISREWILNVGCRNGYERISHLLCEVTLRMRAAGLGREDEYELPMTQEQLGDSVGLTSVHVNRTLKVLAAEGLIERDRHHLRIIDWEGLRRAAGFSSLYLHFDQLAA